jgi:hypothetical protein
MRPLIVAATVISTLMSGTHFASAQSDRPAPPVLLPSPGQECQRGAFSLPVPAPGETTGSANLSDQLSRSNGVICPPAGVDPGISAPPSGVLSLPGTPGGDPNVVPK